MSEDVEARCRSLAEKLRAMLDEKLGEGVNLARNPAVRPIIQLFGITHAHDLDGLDWAELTILAVQAGLPDSHSDTIRHGQNLAQYVDVKGQYLMAAKHTEELEKCLNEQADWRLHSFSTGLEPANTNLSGGFSGRMAIIAVLERAHTGAALGR